MGAANMGSAVSALAKAVAGVGMIGALLFMGWIASWVYWWVFDKGMSW
jgi:hypothetical protein